ncbi:bifunctional NAD(P)H-hydrate repair enzyme Nnr [Vibrio zhanjiangensis]|uniref:Bifunctional NAD(P)H-hydrate repair enzyme n=1 Tax=Vibrio zhanjiangensis TaxID=1046128 RepID=A0ABQ6EXQ6_9VIBR|nr:NAD(P)H-hydrate dehydratase [Vibrio zhanjiangensis]GLT17841.1 bifunctional NAD(P)H-hydrate repair enzyme Nnr [Vibrio zhanjiangensis]
MSSMKPLYSAAQVKSGEVKAAKAKSVAMYELMLRAGSEVFEVMRHQYPNCKRLLVVCGGGNNGGDGYVVARLALEAGIEVSVWQSVAKDKLSGDALTAYHDYLAVGGSVEAPDFSKELDADCIVDAILGTGLTGSVRADTAQLIEYLNHSGIKIISVDLPSGLSSDTGRSLGVSVKALHTVSFIGLKCGLFTAQARDFTGDVHFRGLGVDDEFDKQNTPKAHLLTTVSDFAPLLRRNKSAHKGHHGKALIIGGHQGMGGASLLSSQACMRVGAGLTALLTHPDNTIASTIACPEVMASSWQDKTSVEFRLSQWCDCVAIGPGLGTDSHSKRMFDKVCTSEVNKVLDADALNLLAANPNRDNQRILTPHPAEAARLLECSVDNIEHDRYLAVEKLYGRYGGVIVLKGAGTLIFDGKHTYVCNAGNPGMATAGMGDVLTGVIVGLLAQGESLVSAAVKGVMIHSLAADRDARHKGERGLCASDLLPHIRFLAND